MNSPKVKTRSKYDNTIQLWKKTNLKGTLKGFKIFLKRLYEKDYGDTGMLTHM